MEAYMSEQTAELLDNPLVHLHDDIDLLVHSLYVHCDADINDAIGVIEFSILVIFSKA